jgi:2-polyprenyl-3-methyl-5-hydroxy-6-metoxy-1,4-benzoquinol methylase
MMKDFHEKKAYFNRYWETRDLPSADARSRQRFEVVRQMLDNLHEGASILDIGCGRGVILSALAADGYIVDGCDISTAVVSMLTRMGYDAFVCDIERDPLPHRYDCLLCLEVLQQVFDPFEVLNKLGSALNENGYMIVSVPNEFHLWSRLKLVLGLSHLGHFEESHIRLFTPRRAKELFSCTGYVVEKSIPLPLLPPRMRLLQGFARVLARLSPSLFSLSQLYRIKPR